MFDLISNFEFERDLNQSEFNNNNSGDVASLVEGYGSLIIRASQLSNGGVPIPRLPDAVAKPSFFADEVEIVRASLTDAEPSLP